MKWENINSPYFKKFLLDEIPIPKYIFLLVSLAKLSGSIEGGNEPWFKPKTPLPPAVTGIAGASRRSPTSWTSPI
jgi:hypothetical protein